MGSDIRKQASWLYLVIEKVHSDHDCKESHVVSRPQIELDVLVSGSIDVGVQSIVEISKIEANVQLAIDVVDTKRSLHQICYASYLRVIGGVGVDQKIGELVDVLGHKAIVEIVRESLRDGERMAEMSVDAIERIARVDWWVSKHTLFRTQTAKTKKPNKKRLSRVK